MSPSTGSKRKAETGDHPFRCDKCPGAFTRREHLARHQRTHENERPYACAFCAQRFGRKDLRDRHERNIHPEEGTPQVRNPTDDGVVVAPSSTSKPRSTQQAQVPQDLMGRCISSCFDMLGGELSFVHGATFDPDTHSAGLVRAMCAVGGIAACRTDEELAAISQIHAAEVVAMHKLLASVKADDRRSFDLLAEGVLLLMLSINHIDSAPEYGARDLLAELVRAARMLGLARPLDTTGLRGGRRASLKGEWTEWTRAESWKRLYAVLAILDTVVSRLSAQPALLSLAECQHDLPDSDAMWLARTPEEWYAARRSATPSQPATAVFAGLLVHGTIPAPTTAQSLLLLSSQLANMGNELDAQKAIYLRAGSALSRRDQSDHSNSSTSRRQSPGADAQAFGPEVVAREGQLRQALGVLHERTLAHPSSVQRSVVDLSLLSQMLTSMQMALPSVRIVHGISSTAHAADLKGAALVVLLERGQISSPPIAGFVGPTRFIVDALDRICRARLSHTHQVVHSQLGLLLPALPDVWRACGLVRAGLADDSLLRAGEHPDPRNAARLRSDEVHTCTQLLGQFDALAQYVASIDAADTESRRMLAAAHFRPPTWLQLDGNLAAYHQAATLGSRSAGEGRTSPSSDGAAFVARERDILARLEASLDGSHAMPTELRIRLDALRFDLYVARTLWRVAVVLGRAADMSSLNVVADAFSYLEGLLTLEAGLALQELPAQAARQVERVAAAVTASRRPESVRSGSDRRQSLSMASENSLGSDGRRTLPPLAPSAFAVPEALSYGRRASLDGRPTLPPLVTKSPLSSTAGSPRFGPSAPAAAADGYAGSWPRSAHSGPPSSASLTNPFSNRPSAPFSFGQAPSPRSGPQAAITLPPISPERVRSSNNDAPSALSLGLPRISHYQVGLVSERSPRPRSADLPPNTNGAASYGWPRADDRPFSAAGGASR